MASWLHARFGHYVLLTVVAGSLFLVNLGGPTLWDIDEGNNAEAAREMMERGDWVVPTFNFELRTDKPALLYWLQMAAYRLIGVNETAARLPSALAALLTVLLLYELGRMMFGAGAGLLAGVILASTVMFSAAAHFANPDALLSLFTALTLFTFWRGYARSGRPWFILAGMAAGFAMLAKGPVGLVLPGAVVLAFLLWERRLKLLWDWRLALGFLTFFLVAAPWYAMVGADTKGEFLRGFFLNHNLGRYSATMENHGGPVFYYVLVLVIGLLPWSVFLGPALWHGLRGLRAIPDAQGEQRASLRFLWCWIGTYFVFFTFSGTKLPNYILPLYPPMALLTARFLDDWRRGLTSPSRWVLRGSVACLALAGLSFALGLLIAGGTISLSALHGRILPGLEREALRGLVLVAGAVGAQWCLARQRRAEFIAVFSTTALLFIGALSATGGAVFNTHKAPDTVARTIAAHQTEREIRIGSYQYFQPSLVFYARRQVSALDKEADALEFLACPLASYLVMPASAWNDLQAKAGKPRHVIGRQHDFYRHCDVVVVTNR